MLRKLAAQLMLTCMALCFGFVGLLGGGQWNGDAGDVPNWNDAAINHVPSHVPGEVIVKFTQQPDAAIIGDAATILGGDVQWREMRHAPHAKGKPDTPHPLSFYRIATVDPAADVASLCTAVAELPGVSFACVNGIPRPTYTPNDPLFNSQWALQKISSEGAWDVSTGDNSIIVAIVDTVCLLNHEDLEENIWVNDDPPNGIDDDNNGFIDDTFGWDFVNNDNTVEDVFGHGTQVSGISSARIDNGLGVAGICNATIMTAKWWHQSGSDATVAECCFYASDNGAHVLNLSLSGQGQLPLTEEAVNYAYDNGSVVVAAAGNAGTSAPGYPSAYPNVMAVSAININDLKPGFSNYGPHIDVAAPSPGILSPSPNGPTLYDQNFGGTSAASPHVAGLAALVLSVSPSLTPDEVRDVINSNADDVGDPGRDDFFGNGRINCAATMAAVGSGVCAGDGTLIEGTGQINGFNATCGSDDVYWAAHGASLFFQISDPVVQFELTATAPTSVGGGSIGVDVEASKENDNATLALRLLLFNYASGEYDSMGMVVLATTDAVSSFSPPGNPGDYIEGGTNEVKLLVEVIQVNGLPNVRTQLDEVLFNFD